MRGGFVRLTLGVVALLTLFSSLARAEVPRLVLYHTFPTMGGLGVAVDNSCALHSPPLTGSACTAFDPSAGDVFTTGLINFETGELGRSQKFDPAGKPLSPPSPFGNGVDYGAAVNPVTLDLYVAHGGRPRRLAAHGCLPIASMPTNLRTSCDRTPARGRGSFSTTTTKENR